MTPRPWSVGRRLAFGFASWSSLILAAMAGLAVAFLERSAHGELDELVGEELEEQRTFFESTDRSSAAFASVAAELGAAHPSFRMAWRVWDGRTGHTWGEFGDRQLLEEIEPPEIAPGERISYAQGLRWATMRLPELGPDMLAGMVLDGRERLRAAARLERTVLLAAAAAVLLSCLVASAFGAYVTRLLRRVAREVREADAARSASADEGAPEEIRLVVDALRSLLERVGSQQEQARLLTTGLAHDLRSPIQNLLSSSEVALLRERPAVELRGVLESHLEDLRELALAVDNLVVLCAAPLATSDEGAEDFDLASEIELRLRDAGERASRPDVRLEVEARGKLSMRGDREALLLAVRNVVGNAMLWSPRQGTVRVRVDGGDEQVRVEVEDQGPGIPLEERQLVLEPFRRGRAPYGARAGYGLGLALTRRAVEAHGGRVEIDGPPGGGALVRFTIPRSVESRGAPMHRE